MATIDSSDFRVQIQPTVVTPEWDFGPTDSVAANAVLLTRENLRTVGAYPPRSAYDWDAKLHITQTISGVETAVDLTDMTLTAVYYDPIIRTAYNLTVVKTIASSGEITVSFDAGRDPAAVAGMYRFHIKATETEEFDLLSGWIEILPAVPTV